MRHTSRPCRRRTRRGGRDLPTSTNARHPEIRRFDDVAVGVDQARWTRAAGGRGHQVPLRSSSMLDRPRTPEQARGLVHKGCNICRAPTPRLSLCASRRCRRNVVPMPGDGKEHSTSRRHWRSLALLQAIQLMSDRCRPTRHGRIYNRGSGGSPSPRYISGFARPRHRTGLRAATCLCATSHDARPRGATPEHPCAADQRGRAVPRRPDQRLSPVPGASSRPGPHGKTGSAEENFQHRNR